MGTFQAKLNKISLSWKKQHGEQRREESHFRTSASLGINYPWEKASICFARTVSFCWLSQARYTPHARARACLRMCARVYEMYFSVEHLSIVELQRRRANRRALPNANTVFTCDCSSMHLGPVHSATARREPRLQSSFHPVSSRRPARRWSMHSCGSFAGFCM